MSCESSDLQRPTEISTSSSLAREEVGLLVSISYLRGMVHCASSNIVMTLGTYFRKGKGLRFTRSSLNAQPIKEFKEKVSMVNVQTLKKIYHASCIQTGSRVPARALRSHLHVFYQE